MIYQNVPSMHTRDHGVEFLYEGKHYVYVDAARYAEARTCLKCPFDGECRLQCNTTRHRKVAVALFIMPFTDWQLIQLAN